MRVLTVAIGCFMFSVPALAEPCMQFEEAMITLEKNIAIPQAPESFAPTLRSQGQRVTKLQNPSSAQKSNVKNPSAVQRVKAEARPPVK